MHDPDNGSALFQQAVQSFMQLPGVGRKTAQRYALHLIGLPEAERGAFVRNLDNFSTRMQYCPSCHGFSDDGQPCPICRNARRSRSELCVVADIRDVMAIERAGLYQGLYFILGGIIDPMAGVGPEQLPIQKLLHTIAQRRVEEVILAFSVSMEGETTTFYLQRQIQPLQVKVSVPARGIPFGETIDQTDDQTLGRAITNRTLLFTPTPNARPQPEKELEYRHYE